MKQSGAFSKEDENTMMMEIIEKYPESEFSQELKVFLGIIEKPPDVLALAKAEYSRMTEQDPEIYIPLYMAVVDSFPKTKSAYQSRFFVAYAYEHYAGDIEKAYEIYRELAGEEPTINSEVYINLVKDKLKFSEQEEEMLEEIKESIAYYEMRIEEIETGVNLDERADAAVSGQENASPEAGGELTGTKKIRERNVRIRSRYYSN